MCYYQSMAYALLIRHAQNDWVSKNRLAGWTPGIHLNDAGLKEAELLAERLSGLPLKAIYSSPLARCLETAAPTADSHSLTIQQVEALGEVRYGKWQGKKIKKLSKKPDWHIIQHFPSRFRFPEGESLLEVQQRAVSAIEELVRNHQDELFAVVSHADVIKLAVAHYLGMHIDMFQRLVVSPASVSVVALPANGMVRVLRVNDHGPIEPPPAPGGHKKKRHGKGQDLVSAGHTRPTKRLQSPDGPAPGSPTSTSAMEEMTK
jgi:probable phosphomutase (TIGR03848 family)